jgi:hypothetical protein
MKLEVTAATDMAAAPWIDTAADADELQPVVAVLRRCRLELERPTVKKRTG